MEKKKLYILTYDHGGYVLWKDAVKPRLKELFEWMEKYPRFRTGLDYESFTFDEFEKCDPEVVRLAQELIGRYPDRVGLGATTYGQPLLLTVSEESNVRQLTYAIKTNMKYFGKTPNVYAISEFALHNQIPQLISLCGYKAAILRSHVMGYGYTRTFDSAWGKWIGKDLTAIDSVPTYDGEGRGFNCTTLDNWILSRWPKDTEISLEDYEERFKKYTPLLASRYDDLTQPIEEITKYIENKENYEYVLLEEIPELYGEATDELKTTDNDFPVQMPWGYCGNEIFAGCRKAETCVVEAEKLDAIAFALGKESDSENLDEAWHYVLAAQHHDVTICGILDLSRRFIPTSLNASKQAQEKALKKISSALSEKSDVPSAINMHSFGIDEWIENKGEYLHFVLPPFSMDKAKSEKEEYNFIYSAKDGILSTPNYILQLKPCGIGYIESLATGEKIAENSGALFTGHIDSVDSQSTGAWSVDISKESAKAVYSGKIGTVGVMFEMLFVGASKRIDCRAEFEIHGEKIGKIGETLGLGGSITVNGEWHEGKLCMNLDLNLNKNRRMVRDLPFSISDWSGDVRKPEDYWYEKDKILVNTRVSAEESFDSITHLDGIYWVALRDENQGFAVLNRGCMGVAVKGNRVSIPLVYANEYLCGTRMLEGKFDNEFSLLPFDSCATDAEVHRNAMSYNYQPTLINANANGSLADFESVGGEVILTTFYHEDGKVLARFCNLSDEKAEVKFIPKKGNVKEETDLLGNKKSPIVGDKMLFRPWEIKTVAIEL